MTDRRGTKAQSDNLDAAWWLDRLETGVATVDQGSHIRTINRSARRLLGVRPTALGEDLFDHIPAMLAGPLRGVLDAARRGETATVICRGAHREAGRGSRDVQIVAHPVREAVPAHDETMLEVIGIEEGADRGLRHLQDQFLATAGHELRTPLTVLMLALGLAAKRSTRLPDTHLRLHLDRAIAQARRLNELSGEFVDVVRLQSASAPLSRHPTNLAALTRRVVETAQVMAGAQPILFDSADDEVMVLADARPIEQALRNVLVNAITFSAGRGPIEVRLTTHDRRAAIDIHNQGPEIPPEATTRIFERFYRVNDQRATREGLGLGLFVAREIVQAHDGIIEARPGVRDGATFTLKFPLLE